MASYELKDADVALVIFQRSSGPDRKKYRLAPYLLVTHPDGVSGLMPYPAVTHSNVALYGVADVEADRIEVYDNPPYVGVTDLGIF